MKKYSVVLADPPWEFVTYSDKGRKKSPKYPVMSFSALCSLPVCKIVDDNAALFMWATWPTISSAFTVMKAWGFEYRTLAFDWFKTTKNAKPHFGTGYYFRAGPEPCLLGVRGRMPVAVKNERNIIVAPAREHSRKPDDQYDKIERVYPFDVYNNRIELFASNESANTAVQYCYDVVGYDVDGRDIRCALDDMIRGG